MNLSQISKDIVELVQLKQRMFGEDIESLTKTVENQIKHRIVDILEPEGVYEKDTYYDGLGYYIGIVDSYPSGADYFRREHRFRIPVEGGGAVSKINYILIREIKK